MPQYRKLPPALNDNQIAELVKHELQKDYIHKRKKYIFLNIRNATMIQFGALTGCRPGEIRGLKFVDLDFENRRIYIPGENNKLQQQAVVLMPEPLVEILVQYFIFRQVYFAESEWVFPNQTGGKIDRSTFARIFRDALRRANLYKVNFIDAQGLKRANFNPYSLRHSFGTKVFNRTGDLRKTQACMRHKDINSTIKYIHVNDEDIRMKVVADIFNDLTSSKPSAA